MTLVRSAVAIARQASRRSLFSLKFERAASSTTIGFVGLGKIGAAMATNLLQAGHCLAVHDVEPSAVERLRSEGAASKPVCGAQPPFLSPVGLSAVTDGLRQTPAICRCATDLRSSALSLYSRTSFAALARLRWPDRHRASAHAASQRRETSARSPSGATIFQCV